MIENAPECSCSDYKNCPYSDYKCCIDGFSPSDKHLLHEECRMKYFTQTRETSIVFQNLESNTTVFE